MVGNLTENPTNCAVAAQHVSRGDKARLELPPLAVAGPRETGEMPRHPCTFHRMRTENQMRAASPQRRSQARLRSVPFRPCPARTMPWVNTAPAVWEFNGIAVRNISRDFGLLPRCSYTEGWPGLSRSGQKRQRLIPPLRLRRPKLHASTLRCARICYRLDRPTSRTFYQQGRGIIHRVYPRASIYLSASY